MSPYYQSPIDGHDHFTDAGRQGCEVCTLETERDRLRAKLHELMARDVDVVDLMNTEYGCPDCGVHHACGQVVAERDRLRGVVEAARAYLDEVPATLRDDVTASEDNRLGDLIEAVAALDGSGVMGDSPPPSYDDINEGTPWDEEAP